ncbi:MAG TPA: fibrobacter succinogenes major paralogous domain-containing protein [Saprospiraceae bacterium]|nr:fibrobacter succinogenes major paralogous domain-containing protein [Saprospiraceae bacterium]
MKNLFIIGIALIITNIITAQSGNVGIGTTTPTAKLEVNGSVKITDGTQGAGKVLTSDASGKGSWQTLSTSSSSSDSIGVNEVVWIGCNAWMTKNLDVSKYRNGTNIPLVTNAAIWDTLTTGAYCYFANTSTNGPVYGKLYNWYAVNDPRGLAPEGWHIPSDFEWTTMINTLGGNNIAGGAMKATGTTNWTIPNLGATNLCNFTAQPGGQRTSTGTFNNKGNYGYWWTNSPASSTTAWSRNLNYNDMQVGGATTDKQSGYSVRCVRD